MTNSQIASADFVSLHGKILSNLGTDDMAGSSYTDPLRFGDIHVGAVMAKYLSQGERVHVPGINGIQPALVSTCLHRACSALGVSVPYWVCRVKDIPDDVLLYVQKYADSSKVFYDYHGPTDPRNHVALVNSSAKTTTVTFSAFDVSDDSLQPRTIGVTSLVNFFNSNNSHSAVEFYSGEQQDEFGFDNPLAPPVGQSDSSRRQARTGLSDRREPSIAAPEASHGRANVTGGVVRPRRRVIASKSRFDPTGLVQKGYNASNSVQFNNLSEIFLDTISRDYAQQILEELFAAWGVDMANPNAVKFAEDLVFAFIVSTTASNKADYSREFEIPQSPSLVVSFDVLSRILAEGHALTRRQFARGVADDMHKYIKDADNVHLLSLLAARVGCDPQMAHLAFDGSTHCTGLTSHQQSFTRLLETRNLFEDDSLLAEGASRQLMQGMSSGPRSIISR